MSKRKSKSTEHEPAFSAGILVTMTRAELDEIKAVVPDGMSPSEWCRKILLRVAQPRCEKSDDLKDTGAA